MENDGKGNVVVKYPNVFRRYLATLLDLFLLWWIVFAFSRLPGVAEASMITYGAFVAVLLLYEPLLTVHLCTFGQALMRIRVRTPDGLRRIGMAQAMGRTVVKYLLGGISFLTVPARKDRRAIHDLSSGTIVIVT